MQFEYLGKIPFSQAIQAQTPGRVLGFEPLEPVVTLGLRGERSKDVLSLPERIEVLNLDRGGQATLHNPGQLVIFPVLDVRPFGGARRWIEALTRVTQKLAHSVNCELRWENEAPGLYLGQGKVVSLGVRLKKGVSTHGIAINVRNNLAEFDWIRSCGQAGRPMAHLPTDLALSDLFKLWSEHLQAEVDNARNLVEFMDRSNTDGSVGAVGSAFP